ncbi:MAG: hypothetical protein M4579_000333 [Chaenotheca gracillima]|nr:MAG: hypothetical protein M4579_000333 [Chaenotheca gracillima]
MRVGRSSSRRLLPLALLACLSTAVQAVDVLKTSGISSCLPNGAIKVNKVNISFDRTNNQVTFDASGSSATSQNVTASLVVSAYGRQVYQKDFDPCDDDTKVDQLCPVPAGDFSAKGTQKIPDNYANMIPSIAFQIPDLEGSAKLQLKSKDTGKDVACIESDVTNGRTAEVAAVSYVAIGVAGAALAMSAVSAVAAAGTPGAHGSSPGFGDVVGWFQSMAMNGMLSVNYPPVYRSFTKNFAFSSGLIPWNHMQLSIDDFRRSTGGNLTTDSVEYLRNATLIYPGSAADSGSNVTKRGIDLFFDNVVLGVRDVTTKVNGSSTNLGGSGANNGTNDDDNKAMHVVHGIQGYVEQLMIPQANTFMTVLLVFAIVIGAITVGILLFKVILEVWALFGSFPKKLVGFRKRYWGLLARTITNLILVLYGVWTLYCVFQFTHGDSWAAKLLAGLTLGIFTAVLAFFSFRIWQLARRYRQAEGDSSALYEDEKTWRNYSLFYDQYKKNLWWIFLPAIIYMFAKGCVIAAGDGHGLAQTAGQLIVESLMLAMLLWNRPYATKAGNWINVFIQVVRVLSVICILVFVEELGIAQDTKTITGVVLIAVQSALTGALAILIAVNAIIICVRENPHNRKKKEAEKYNRDLDNLTPLDARNSLLMDPGSFKDHPIVTETPIDAKKGYYAVPTVPAFRDITPPPGVGRGRRRESGENLVGSAASIGHHHSHSRSMSPASEIDYRRTSSPASRSSLGRQYPAPDLGYRGQAI